MPFPASFEQFHGNRSVVDGLRAAIAAGRLAHSLIIAGPRGAGKYTLALLLTMALECERQPRVAAQDGRVLASFCGECKHCTRIAAAAELDRLVGESVDAREEMRDVDKRETRVLIQTHPDVLVVPPDPPQLLIKLGQIRTVIARSQRLPAEAPRKVFIITSSAFMKEAANSLLKVLEEPPADTHILLLAESVGELLPTVRSRCAIARLGALPVEEIAAILAANKPEVPARERELLARLANGAAGSAMSFDLPANIAARADALTLLHSAEGWSEHTSLFKMTETYRSGADGQLKTSALLRAASSLLEDLMLLQAGLPERIRNIDIQQDLDLLAKARDFAWIESAVRGLAQVQTGMRRNLLRGLSLDAFAAELESAAV